MTEDKATPKPVGCVGCPIHKVERITNAEIQADPDLWQCEHCRYAVADAQD